MYTIVYIVIVYIDIVYIEIKVSKFVCMLVGGNLRKYWSDP